jgi:AI-2 transport protein TqsA
MRIVNRSAATTSRVIGPQNLRLLARNIMTRTGAMKPAIPEVSGSVAWKALVGAAALVVLVAGLRVASTLLIPLVGAFFLAVISFPLVAWLRSRGLPVPLAVLATVVAVLVALAGPATIVGTAATRFVATVPRYRAALERQTQALLGWLETHGIETASVSLLNPSALLDWVTSTVTGVTVIVSNLLLVVLVMAFILLEAAELPPKLRAAFGMDEREIDRLVRSTGQINQFIWLKTLMSLATGLLVGSWAALLGVDFAVLWGLLAFLFNYVPNFGSILAAVPPVLLALLQFGPGRAAGVAAGYIVVNVTLSNVIEPRLMGHRLGLSPLALLLLLVFWGWLWGPIGLLLAVPITMVLRIAMESFEPTRRLALLLARAPQEPVATGAGSPAVPGGEA